MELLRDISRGLSRRSATVDLDRVWAYLFGGGEPSKSGVYVTADEALKQTTVLAATRAMANGLSQPLFTIGKPARSDGRGLSRDRSHPLDLVLSLQPNEWQTSYDFRESMMVHTILTGDFLAIINRVNGRVRELLPVLPAAYTIEQRPNYELLYRVSRLDGTQLVLKRNEVLHIRGFSWNTYQGMELLRLAREAIGLAVATEETHSRLHSNGARPSGILTSDSKIDDAARTRLKEQWQSSYAGLGNVAKTPVLSNGIKWQQISMSGVDSQHLETRRFQIEEICRAIGVFPQMVGYSDKTATYASAEAFFQAHVRLSLAPWAERIEQQFMRDLLTKEEKREGYRINLDLRSLERGDTRARTEYYASGIQNGWLSRNEAREWEGLNPLDGLDEMLSPMNMQSNAEAAANAGTTQTASAGGFELKKGRVLSRVNEGRIRNASGELQEVLATLPEEADANV
jgi:HK97 family phage portal protein